MSLEANQMALESKVYELTEKFNTLQQSTSLLQLEKDAYISEVEKLKDNNTELVEKLEFLQTVTTETKMQARLLSKQYSSANLELKKEDVENEELKITLQQNSRLISSITAENNLLKETNKRLQIELENMNMKYDKLSSDTTHEIEIYNTKVMELEREAALLQQQIESQPPPGNTELVTGDSAVSFSDLDDFDEKSLEQRDVREKPHKMRNPTLDLRLTSMLSYSAQRSGSMSMSRGTPTSQSYSNYTSLKRQQSYRKGLQGFPMLAIQQSQEYSDNMSELSNDEEPMFVQNGSPTRDSRRDSVASFVSNYGQFVFTAGQSPDSHSGNSDSLEENESRERNAQMLQIIHEQTLKIVDLQEQMHKENIGFEVKLDVMEKKNATLTNQLQEKDGMIRKFVREKTELKEEFKMKTERLMTDWKSDNDLLKGEKQQIIGQMQQSSEKITQLESENNEFHLQYKQMQTKLNQKIKQVNHLNDANKELQMMLTTPPQSSCYFTEWFNN